MAKVRKYLKGDPFANAIEAATWILAGNWIFDRHKPVHPGWASGWSLKLLRTMTPGLCRAVVNPEWKPQHKEDELSE